jgi:hypothetical protein
MWRRTGSGKWETTVWENPVMSATSLACAAYIRTSTDDQ